MTFNHIKQHTLILMLNPLSFKFPYFITDFLRISSHDEYHHNQLFFSIRLYSVFTLYDNAHTWLIKRGGEHSPPLPLLFGGFSRNINEHRISSVNACVYLTAKILISDEDPKPFLHISLKFPSFAIPAFPTPE